MKTELNDFAGNIKSKTPVSGGDINEAYVLTLEDGPKLFLKRNRRENADFFRAEAEGLSAIKETGAIRTPEVLGFGSDAEGGWLLLSMVESGRKNPDFFEHFGRNLAAMHNAPTETFVNGGRFGFLHDNFIGAGYQKNDPRDSWVAFFRDCRLKPQLEKADRYFDGTDKNRIDHLLSRLEEFLFEPEKPALLHGDLWGGNYMAGPDGEAWLIDPAVYVGCAEADLAMTELFGGFPRAFYAAYHEVNPEIPGYEDRRDLYNLYHLTNHLNLFGGGYLSSVRGILRRYS